MPRMTLQYFFDMNTTPEHMQIINVSAGGEMIQKRLQPFFAAYKYFKLGKVKLSMIPASTLPVDPTGLSYELGENTVDPRDQLTPGLVRITNGEDMQVNLEGIDSDTQHKIFNTMMLDRRWFKWSLQRGLKKSAMPLYWDVGNLHQTNYPDMIGNFLQLLDSDPETTGSIQKYFYGSAIAEDLQVGRSDPRGLFQTGKKFKLGWLPTDSMDSFFGNDDDIIDVPSIHPVPCVPLFTIILPPAYKTKYFYRVYVTETVYFREPVVNNFEQFASLDRFIRPGEIIEKKPTEAVTYSRPAVYPPNDGAAEMPGRSPEPVPTPEFPSNPEIGDVVYFDSYDFLVPNTASGFNPVPGVDCLPGFNVPKGWIAFHLTSPSPTEAAEHTGFMYLPGAASHGAGSYPQVAGDLDPATYGANIAADTYGQLSAFINLVEDFWEAKGFSVAHTTLMQRSSFDTSAPAVGKAAFFFYSNRSS